MGNKNSSLKGGSNQTTMDYTDIKKKIEEIMNSVLTKHMSEITTKKYCQKLKVFMTNDILMKYSKDSLQEFSKNIFIGVEKDTSSEVEESKALLCKKLTNLYIRKLNLIASIHIILDLCYKRIYAMKKGNRCLSRSKPYEISNILSVDADNIRDIETNRYDIKEKDTALDSSNTIGLTNIDLRGKLIDSMKKKYDIDEKAKEYVFISELLNEKDCINQKGRWVDDKTDLIAEKLKPDYELKGYNKKWKVLMNEMENKFNHTSLDLLMYCNYLVEEKIDTKTDGTSVKTYIDKEVDEIVLNDLIKRTKPKLIFLYNYVNERYLIMSGLPIIDQLDVDKSDEIKQKYEEMKKLLQSSS